MKRIILCYSLLLGAFPAYAADSGKTLLRELAKPSKTIENRNNNTPAQPALDSITGEPKVSNLFTLEELHRKQESSFDGLYLPDEDLPTVADLPLDLNEKVERFINYFQTKGRATFANWLQRSTRYIPMMREVLLKEGLPEELVYMAMIESGFRLHAKSPASAVGPWQFMPATGRRYSLRIDRWVDERKDPVKATVAAAMYLKDLYSMFNGDWHLATAGYNAGEGKIKRAMNRYDTDDFWELSSKGSCLKKETKDYVPKLLAAAIIAKDPAKYGFSEVMVLPVIQSDTVVIKGRTNLELVASLTGTTVQSIKELNPSILHWCTPPNYPNFELRVPKGTGAIFETAIAEIPEEQWFSEKAFYAHYRTEKEDSLEALAARFNTTAEQLARLNGLSSKQKLVLAGRTMVVPVQKSVDFSTEGKVKQPVQQPVYYTVKKGDTLWSIARRFKVSVRLLTAWNNLKHETATLVPGKKLLVAQKGTQSNQQG